MARVVRCGEAPSTLGGDFERLCVARLGEKLPEDYVVVAHLGLPTKQSYFYDVDVIVASSDSYDVLECKLILPQVVVGEDFLSSSGGYYADNIFSIHENKCRVVKSRLADRPFSHARDVRVVGRVIVPDDSDIRFLHEPHNINAKVVRLGDFIREVKSRPKPRQSAGVPVDRQWQEYRSSYQAPGQSRDGRLGRFRVKRRLESQPNMAAYLGVDEPPCKVDVHLLEMPFPKGLAGKDLDAYLAEASRAMTALRRLRHPLIQCVTGHFFTGSSLVQISDWFDGQSLERLVAEGSLSLDDKVLLMSRIAEALVYCHQQSVFHRNLSPANVLIGGSCSDIQITGFECVKDSRQAGTALAEELRRRDRRLLPPEELQPSDSINYRLYDVFQAGVLFFWILEDGRWPFDSTLDFVTGDGSLPFSDSSDDRRSGLVTLVSQMLSRAPADRPDPFSRVLDVLHALG